MTRKFLFDKCMQLYTKVFLKRAQECNRTILCRFTKQNELAMLKFNPKSNLCHTHL